MSKNKHGLSRTIPNDTKYKIRKDDGFGCVHCGLAIYDYEHIDPEYIDAKEHDATKMTLLCPTVHAKVTRKFISKQTVKDWKKSPWAKRNGHVHDKFDINTDKLEVWVGAAKIEGYEKLISIDNECVLSVKAPEEKGGQFQLSAILHDNENNPILTIENNEWKAQSDAFDIVTSEGKIGIRKDGKFVLKIFLFPPNVIVFEEINMLYNGLKIVANSNQLTVKGPVDGGGEFNQVASFTSINDSTSLFNVFSDKPGIQIGAGQISNVNVVRPRKNVSAHSCGRNNPCPCGNKKKYKDCCSPKYDYIL